MFVVDSTWQQSARLDGFGGVEASSSFPSLMGDVSVCSGKWMYEVTLLSCGIQQLGWCTLECNFTNENGVGDSVGELRDIGLGGFWCTTCKQNPCF